MKEETQLIAAGRPHSRPAHPVNHPVERASTFLFPTYDDFLEGAKSITYGRLGTRNHRALEEAVNILEGGFETRLAPSGLAAVNMAIIAFCEAGDHLLVTDSVYDPVRKFCDRFLNRFGVTTTYYDPQMGEEISTLMTPRTKAIVAESPGSLTFEIQDLPALAKAARAGGAKLIVDNTYGAGHFLKPLSLGAHVSIQAGTKYLAGHADCLIGTISSADEATAKAVFTALLQLGSNVSADDAYLALRGVRTLPVRLARHQETGLKLAKWLAKRPEVDTVLHPALKTCPGHAIWKRDFTGASGLFSVILKPVPLPALKAYFNALKLFGIGFSWGGFESLCVHARPEMSRTAEPWQEEGPTIRFHAGLEDADDLISDLDRAFAAMNAAKV
ncbi:MAG TPA: cystathionine beta-lyase [Parvularculaceae bacterium]|nr:cystathionine beta-lyase [Parvularculaceae bacterium]